MKYTLKENEKITIEIVNGCVVFTTEEKDKEKDKEKEKEPFFVNSHGSKFYKGDKGFRVDKSNNVITYWFVHNEPHICLPDYYQDTEKVTELLTKEQAEQYVKDNRVFEIGALYKAYDKKRKRNVVVEYFSNRDSKHEVFESMGFFHKLKDLDVGEKLIF